MRITGILHTIGTIHECDDETIKGILITAGDATLRAASDILCATVDIYPHAEFLPTNLECTPENYAHALARLAHAEDNLAREVRASQTLTDGNRALNKMLNEAQVRIAELEAALGAILVDDRARAAAWLRGLTAPPYFYGVSYESIARCIESGLDPEVVSKETA